MPTAPFNQPPKFHEAAYRAAISTLKMEKKPLGEGPAIVRHLKSSSSTSTSLRPQDANELQVDRRTGPTERGWRPLSKSLRR
jgi:hypothetical protein